VRPSVKTDSSKRWPDLFSAGGVTSAAMTYDASYKGGEGSSRVNESVGGKGIRAALRYRNISTMTCRVVIWVSARWASYFLQLLLMTVTLCHAFRG
jgi:hypothetical protein